MKLLSRFSPKYIKKKMELSVIFSQLQYLASSMANNTDKPSDLIRWQNLIKDLQEIDIDVDYLIYLKDSYQTLYTLYLKKHYPELIIE